MEKVVYIILLQKEVYVKEKTQKYIGHKWKQDLQSPGNTLVVF